MTRRVKSEAALDLIVDDLTALWHEHAPSRPVIAAVAGGSGDGKGHLIDRIIGRLRSTGGLSTDAIAVLALDDYYIGVEAMRSRGVPHFDHPDALDLELAAEHLQGARARRPQRIPKYDFASGERRASSSTLPPSTFILVDGLFALREPILSAADYKIFVESDHDSSMLRRLFRDAGPAGRTRQSSRKVLEMYFTTVWPAKKEFIDPTAAQADVIVESRWDPAVEARRAGPVQYHLKARAPRLSDDAITYLAKARRLGGGIRQIDRFLKPRVREHLDEMLRLRLEPDVLQDVLLTYKGPFLPAEGVGARPVTSPIDLPYGAMKWFTDAYATAATIKKTRVLYQAGGTLIARDQVDLLGNFIEVRTDEAAEAKRLPKLLAKLCPGEPQLTESYFDLWKRQAPPYVTV